MVTTSSVLTFTLFFFFGSRYLNSLRSYLEGFLKRVKPLSNMGEIGSEAQQEFDTKWAEGSLPGWPKIDQEDAPPTDLFCVACKKQYAKDTVYNAHLTSKKHIKAAAQLASGANGAANGGSESISEAQSKVLAEKAKPEQEMAFTEVLIKHLAGILKQQVSDTKENVERRQTLTGRERDVSPLLVIVRFPRSIECRGILTCLSSNFFFLRIFL